MNTLILEIELLDVDKDGRIKKSDVIKLIKQKMKKPRKLTPNSNVYILHEQGDVCNDTGAGICRSYFKMKYSDYTKLLSTVEKYKNDLQEIEQECTGGGHACTLEQNLYELFTRAKILREPPEHIECCEDLLSNLNKEIDKIRWEKRKTRGLGCGEYIFTRKEGAFSCGIGNQKGNIAYCSDCKYIRSNVKDK